MKEIINHRPALHIPPVDLTVAPGRRAANVQLGRQRVNTMAGRGRNQPQPLQGADPAIVQILQMMQNRDANRDNSRKQFLMFPKECFTGQDKKLAKSHWAEFSKYLDYQNQQGTIPRDLAHLPKIKSMFKLTLQDIALGWFETKSPTWLTEDQMKQSFLKTFNPWGDTRHQQQNAWNKLKFDMTKDNIKVISISWPLLIYLKHNKTLAQGTQNIVGDNAEEDAEITEAPMAVEMAETLITGMIIRNMGLAAVKDNATLIIIEGMDKIMHIQGDDNSGMEMTRITVTETIGIEIPILKVILTGVEDGILITDVKNIVIMEEGEDGIPISNIMIQGIKRNYNFQIQIIIAHPQWDINTDTQSHMASIHIRRNNNNIKHKCQPHLNKLQIFVSCVIVKAITTINANLQVNLWPTHKKPLIKADHIVIKTLIMVNGHKATMITMTLMGNLFSSGGSRCH